MTTSTPTNDPFALPAGHPALAIIRECLDISSGCIATLIDSGSYAEVYAVRTNWILFLASRADQTAACRNWVEAWHWFWSEAEAA